ncbi:MAG: DNA polymerase IV [Bacteroidota bacterium]
MRKIIHIDMDAFYASVEQRDNPELRGRPVAVGGSPSGRGVVMTASYEARKYGVHSAQSSKIAIQRCPNIIFVRPRFEAYKEASERIREVFFAWTDLVEPLSLDEAYLDVTENKPGLRSALLAARRIKDLIRERTELTATAGVSYNKFLAKMASGYKKPNGLNFIPPENGQWFIDELKVSKFHGIGDKTAAKMEKLGLYHGVDLREAGLPFLERHFGKMGRFYFRIANGDDTRAVVPNRPRKSASVEDTFAEDIDDLRLLDSHIDRLSGILMERLGKKELYGRTVTLKVKYADFQIITRSKSFSYPVTDRATVARTAKELLRKTEAGDRMIRLLGVGESNFDEDEGDDAYGEPDAGDQLQLPL